MEVPEDTDVAEPADNDLRHPTFSFSPCPLDDHTKRGPIRKGAKHMDKMEEATETIDNPERGCGHLLEHGMYLRASVFSTDGFIPAVVEFKEPILYQGKFFKGYRRINGMAFEMINRGRMRPVFKGRVGETIVQNYADTYDLVTGEAMEFERYMGRLLGMGASDAPFDSIPEAWAQDLLMFAGATYYETPEEFIEEVRQHGLSKRIGGGGKPPEVVPDITKLYLAHKRAVLRDKENPGDPDEWLPGIIGYCYLNEVIFTEKQGVPLPEHIKRHAANGDLRVVKIGPEKWDEEDAVVIAVVEGDAATDAAREEPEPEWDNSPLLIDRISPSFKVEQERLIFGGNLDEYLAFECANIPKGMNTPAQRPIFQMKVVDHFYKLRETHDRETLENAIASREKAARSQSAKVPVVV